MHVFWWRKFNWIRTGTTQAVDSHQLRCLADSESKPILLLAGHDKYMNEHCVRYDHFSCSTLLNCLRLTPGGQLVIVGIFFHFGCSWSDSTADRQTEKYNIILSPAGQLQITADNGCGIPFGIDWIGDAQNVYLILRLSMCQHFRSVNSFFFVFVLYLI